MIVAWMPLVTLADVVLRRRTLLERRLNELCDEQQRLIGIVSEHDLLAALDGGRRWADLEAQDIMSGNPYSVRKETTVATLIHVLKASDLIRVPVIDARNQLVGIVARRDVVRACLDTQTNAKP